MSREILSQAEIDALLRKSDNEEAEKDLDLDQYLSPFDQDALGEIGNISFGSASTALSTLLGQKVEITTPSLSAVNKKDLNKLFPKPHVAVHVEYTQGFEGINLFVLKSEDTKIIADLMMGGNGIISEVTELSEMEISAVQEAMNQMMGSAATSMSTIFNTPVNISPPGVDVIDISKGQGDEKVPADDVLVIVSFRLKIGKLIDSNIMQLTSLDFAKDMVAKLIGEDTMSNEPIEQVAAASQSQSVASQSEAIKLGDNNEHNSKKQQNMYQHQVVQPAHFSDFNYNHKVVNEDPNLGLLMDIPLQITVELGRTKKIIKDILELGPGSIIELDKLAGEPVDILANNKLIAKGEVVVIDENFGVRVTDIISQFDRVKKLQ